MQRTLLAQVLANPSTLTWSLSFKFNEQTLLFSLRYLQRKRPTPQRHKIHFFECQNHPPAKHWIHNHQSHSNPKKPSKKTLAVIECNSSQHTSYLTVGSTIFTTSSNSCKVGRSCPSVQTINAVFQSYKRPHLTQGSSLFPRTRFHRQLEWYPQTRSL